ncbi:hypothetical protein ACFQ9X_32170 [Catenulispora yoronensis]
MRYLKCVFGDAAENAASEAWHLSLPLLPAAVLVCAVAGAQFGHYFGPRFGCAPAEFVVRAGQRHM